MNHPLLKSFLWALTGLILDISATPPKKPSKNDNLKEEGLVMTFIIRYGVPLFRVLSWYMTVVEILTIQSAPFRRMISFPSSSTSSVANIDAPFLAAFTLLATSFLVRFYCFRTLGDFFTFEVTIRPNHKLITHGPYRFVRHPSYSAFVGVLLGYVLLHFAVNDTWVVNWALLLWGVHSSLSTYKVWSRSINEDDVLQKRFGEEWESYRKRVPCRFIPGVL